MLDSEILRHLAAIWYLTPRSPKNAAIWPKCPIITGRTEKEMAERLYTEQYVRSLRLALAEMVRIIDLLSENWGGGIYGVSKEDYQKVIKVKCAFLGQQNCHSCADTECCDNLSGGTQE